MLKLLYLEVEGGEAFTLFSKPTLDLTLKQSAIDISIYDKYTLITLIQELENTSQNVMECVYEILRFVLQ
jgi:hypothetical protein